jgi:Rrf2 family protein
VLYSKYCEYVIRALSYLSLHDKRDEYIMVKEIAEETHIPYHFLSKIFQNLATTNWVESKKGKKGGFTIAVDDKTISLMDIIEWSDGSNTFDNCILGERECELDTQCKLQHKCTGLRKDIISFFESTTIRDVSECTHDIELTENVNNFIATRKAL